MTSRQDDEAEERRLDLEGALMDADRMMMQTVQTALSLIGFGFTINTFFNDVVDSAEGGAGARGLGMALLAIGLLLLIMGVWTQSKFRRELLRRYVILGPVEAGRAQTLTRFTPGYVAALMLMVVGLVAFGFGLARWLL